MTGTSVVIPTYESADTVSRAIESALAQTYDDLEVLVVDDASTDETPAVVREYDDPRVQYLVHDRNRGGSAARNTGIEAADGEYVGFLDADDEWHSEKLERQVACLEGRSEDWVGAYCGMTKKLPRKIELLRAVAPDRLTSPATNVRYGKEGGAELIRDVLLRPGVFGGASTLLVERRTVVEMGGFDEEFPRHQDVEFLVRLLKRGKLAYVDDVLVRKHPSGRPSSETVAESKELLFSAFRPEIERLERSGVPVTKHHQHALARSYFMDGRFRGGARCLLSPDPHLRNDQGLDIGDAVDFLWPVCLGLYGVVRGSLWGTKS